MSEGCGGNKSGAARSNHKPAAKAPNWGTPKGVAKAMRQPARQSYKPPASNGYGMPKVGMSFSGRKK